MSQEQQDNQPVIRCEEQSGSIAAVSNAHLDDRGEEATADFSESTEVFPIPDQITH